jgi:signal peptide peptidase SppA
MTSAARSLPFDFTRPWALAAQHLQDLHALRRSALGIGSASTEQLLAGLQASAAERAGRLTQAKPASGAIAVVPVYGYIVMRSSWLEAYGVVTSIETTRARLRAAIVDPSVSGVLLDIDSPGGSTDGVEEFANEIYALAKKKNIIALANPCAASGAYWLGVNANHLYCIPGAVVGSIGVYGMHEDISEALRQQGCDVTLISAGKYKTEGNPFEPLSDEGEAYWQSQVDVFYSDFTRSVARGRHTTVAEVRGGMGQGRMVLADQAAAANMACGVFTWDQVVRSMTSTNKPDANSNALARCGSRKCLAHQTIIDRDRFLERYVQP